MADTTEDVVRNPNEVRDLIYTSLSLADYTKIPILFLGNPGIAKTTGVRTWAEQFGFKVTTLIGTQRVAEEILGYMVNDTGEKRLITYTPDWYDEIMENKAAGFKTLLFVDELSQAPDNVQGAMLQLIFDRRVGGRANYLPDDCLVVSAANYKGNIPPQCGIQAPTLNRFCIINVTPVDGIGLAEEFLQSDDERMAKIPVFQNNEITKRIEESARRCVKDGVSHLFSSYSRKENNEVVLDVNHTDYSDIFDQPGPIYNFITGRTIHYAYKMALGMIHFGIVRKGYKNIIQNIIFGLLGQGTNTFPSLKARDEYCVALMSAWQKILRRSVEDNMSEINQKELDLKGKTIDQQIDLWMRAQEAGSNINDINLHRVLENIQNKYSATTDGMVKIITSSNFDANRFLNDMQKIETLYGFLKKASIQEIKPVVKELSIIITAYDSYKNAILNQI